MSNPKIGDLRVWWIPQVPGKPFHFHVKDVQDGVTVMDALALYDLFQFKHNIKPDYSNAGGLESYCPDGWESWCDEETGEDDPKKYLAMLEAK